MSCIEVVRVRSVEPSDEDDPSLKLEVQTELMLVLASDSVVEAVSLNSVLVPALDE